MKVKILFTFLIPIIICLQPEEYTATITFNETGPSFIGEGVTIDGKYATIKSNGSFLVTGNSEEGGIIVDTNSVNLYLKDLDLMSHFTAPIIINKQLKNIILTSLENVHLTNNESITSAKGEFACIKVKKESELTILNENNITLISYSKNVIKGGVQSYIIFGQSNSYYDIQGYKNGISCDNYLEFNGGNFNIKTETGDAIKSSPDDTDLTSEGKIVINNGNFNIESFSDAFQAKKIININNGVFDIKTENGWDSTTFNESTMSGKGFKISDNETGCEIIIKNGEFKLNTADDAFHSDGNLSVINGNFEIHSKDDGFHSDFNLTIGQKDTKIGPNINIHTCYEGLEAQFIDIYYGNIYINASDDGINAAGGNSSSDPGPGPQPPDSDDSDRPRPGPPDHSDQPQPQPQPPGPSDHSDHPQPQPPDPSDSDRPPQPPDSDHPFPPSGKNDLYFAIYDGVINILCKGDGIDSNGAIYINGGSLNVFSQGPEEGQDNEPIDHEGDFTIFNSEILCGGNKGMNAVHQGIKKGNQKYAYYDKTIEANKILKIKNEENTVVKKETIPKKIGYVFYTSTNLTDKYKFYLADSTEGEESEIKFNFGTTPSGNDDDGSDKGNNSENIGIKKILFGVIILCILI